MRRADQHPHNALTSGNTVTAFQDPAIRVPRRFREAAVTRVNARQSSYAYVPAARDWERAKSRLYATFTCGLPNQRVRLRLPGRPRQGSLLPRVQSAAPVDKRGQGSDHGPRQQALLIGHTELDDPG